MDKKELVEWLDRLLVPSDYSRIDASLNGLQVGPGEGEVKKVAVAVDACMESFSGAVQAGADFLIVHHGLFWGKPLAVVDDHYRRISFLVKHNLALYASHLPLDAHAEIGNNAGLAQALDLQEVKPFGEYHGMKLGVKGKLDVAVDIQDILDILGLEDDQSVTVLPFGGKKIRTVGIISGGGAGNVIDALDDSLDLYLTGEALHQMYHTCLEGRLNLIAGGHYTTETYGPQLLGRRIERDLGLDVEFIDCPTGL